ncbi:MAG: hypothetical protein ACT4UP_07475 [Gammaproteobacteria bacterium]
MTTDRLELLLALGIVAVYLLDALRFLRPREALVERIGADRWRVLFGAVRFELLGRRPALPNPLRPDRMLFLARWQAGPDVSSTGTQWPATGRAASTLAGLCVALLVVVVAVAPALLLIGQGLWFAVAIGAGYLAALAAAIVLIARAADFGMRRWHAAGIGVIGVICLPCAPNLLRAACGSRTLSVELPSFAEASAGGAERRGFRGRFARVLRNELAAGTDDPREDERLQAILRRVEAET